MNGHNPLDAKNDFIDIELVRENFPALQQTVNGHPLVYLDNAATTLKPKEVVESIRRHYALETANIHRGIHFLSEQATAKFEATRRIVQEFIGARHLQEIIFTKGTTEGLNLLAHSYGMAFLKRGDEILISGMEHHSNIVPWQLLCQRVGCELKVVPLTDSGELEMDALERLLTPKVKLVSLVYVSNSLGTINPMKKIISMVRTRSPQAVVAVDAAQAVAHMPINVVELDADFLVFSGHKLYGPTGVGVLYGKEKILQEMPPYQGGGDMIESVTFEKTTFNQLPYKFEAGTPAIAEVIALGDAIAYVRQLGLSAIAKREHELLLYGHELLAKIKGLTFIGTAKDKSGILSFVLDSVHPHDIGTFADQKGVALRTGHHCTQPVMKRFGVPATARASLAFYNTKEELDHLYRTLLEIKEFFS